MLTKHWKAIILIVLGSAVWSATMVKSGIIYSFGEGFWGPNGHDGIWHLALSRSLARGTLENPVFSGDLIKNYHIGFDLILALLTKVTGVSAQIWYFQIIPPFIAVMVGILSYKLVLDWGKSQLAGFWVLFFVYFGGSVGSIVHLVRYGRLGGDSMFWAQSSATTLINPPFALSLVVILLGLIVFQRYLKKGSLKDFILSVFLFGILIEIKSYAGVLVILSLFFITALELIYKSKTRKRLLVFSSMVALVSMGSFLFVNSTPQRLFVVYPFWFLETLMSFGERFNWERYHQAMINYRAVGNIVKAFWAYGTAFWVFILGNLGSRIFSLVWLWKKVKYVGKIDQISKFILGMIFFGAIIPMFVVQEGTAWNTIQFFYYSLFFSGILSGVVFSDILAGKKAVVSGLIIVIVMVTTLPTTITTMNHYLPPTPPAKISTDELDALDFLNKQPLGVVLTLFLPSDNRFLFEGVSAPRPLYLYDSTAYVSAYSNKPTFFDDRVNLNIMGYDWPEREKMIKQFQSDPNTPYAREILYQISPDYIYYIKDMGLKGLDENYLGVKNIYDNSEVIVYKVEQDQDFEVK